MSEQATQDAVRQSVTVPLPVERAFALFSEQIGAWWPHSYSIGASPFRTAVIEPRTGGRWFERGSDGAECDWGVVLAYDPPRYLSLSWQIGGDWRYDPDPEHGSVVDVRFIPEGEGSTRVELEHHGFERHGASAAQLRDAVGSPGGWAQILESFRQAA